MKIDHKKKKLNVFKRAFWVMIIKGKKKKIVQRKKREENELHKIFNLRFS